MCMGQFGMHLLGQQRVENTKLTISTNPSLVGTKTSNFKVALVKALPHAGHLLALHLALEVWALSSSGPCNGSKTTTWCTTIAMILGETTIWSQNAKHKFVHVGVSQFQVTLYTYIVENLNCEMVSGVVFVMVPLLSVIARVVERPSHSNDWNVLLCCDVSFCCIVLDPIMLFK